MLNLFRRTAARRAMAALLCVCIVLPIAGPAMAWKPKTHVYLAQIALKDAVDDGRVTIMQTDYETGRVIGPLGDFEVNPRILEALRAKPAQYYAGVVGPDAYPDMLTGQQLIHPGASRHVLGDPSHNEPASKDGVDAWLTYLWRQAYGYVDPTQQRLREVQSNPLLFNENRVTNTPEIRAFVAGYLTHAAGDMFMHTFVNHYTGGDFAFYPDKLNAVKHLVLEGYVGERTPEPREATSIAGVEDFIYRRMIRADPGSVLEQRLFSGMTQATSVPAIFSMLRNGLQKDVDEYYRERNRRNGPARVAYQVAHGPAATYREAWIADIDRGLRAWPAFSHALSGDLVYNPHGGTNVVHARDIATDYAFEHLAKMAGTPDVVAETAEFILVDLRRLLPSLGLLTWLKEILLDAIVMSATGMTFDEFVDYTTSPSTHFDKYMNAPGGGYDGRTETLISLEAFNRTVLQIDDRGVENRRLMFDPEGFAPAFNTLQMTKMLFLSEKGMRDLLAALEAKGVATPPMPTAPGAYENAMLGFLNSLDGDNRWQGSAGGGTTSAPAFFLATGGGAAWRNLFKKQIGERPGWLGEAGPGAEGQARDDARFETIERWAARVEATDYEGAAGERVTVTMTFRNDTTDTLSFPALIGRRVRALLKVEGAEPVDLERMEYVHTDQTSAPQWHYARGDPVPPQGRIQVRFVFAAGSEDRQRQVTAITVIEQRPRSALTPMIPADAGSRDFAVDAYGSSGGGAAKTGAPGGPAPNAPASATGSGSAMAARLINAPVDGERMVARIQVTNLGAAPRTMADGLVTAVLVAADGTRVAANQARFLNVWGDPPTQAERQLESNREMWLSLIFQLGQRPIDAFTAIEVIERDGPGPDARVVNRTLLPLPGAVAQAADTPAPQTPALPASPGIPQAFRDASSAFQDAGNLQLRLAGTGRSAVYGHPGVEVRLTARNHHEQRMGLQYLGLTPSLITSDGRERQWDGNYYGASASELLNATVWMEQNQEAPLTLVFPDISAGVEPVALVLRRGTTEVLRLDLGPRR